MGEATGVDMREASAEREPWVQKHVLAERDHGKLQYGKLRYGSEMAQQNETMGRKAEKIPGSEADGEHHGSSEWSQSISAVIQIRDHLSVNSKW